MKPIHIETTMGLDRTATWNEVRSAMAVSSQDTLQLMSVRGDCLEVVSDFTDCADNLTEDDMWLAIVNEMPDSKSN